MKYTKRKGEKIEIKAEIITQINDKKQMKPIRETISEKGGSGKLYNENSRRNKIKKK